MKRSFSISLIILLAALCLSGCGNAYENGYSDGYDDGYEEGSTGGYSVESKIDDAYDEGYSEGFDDGAEAAAEYIAEAAQIHLMWDEGVFILEEYFNGQCSRSDAFLALEYLADHLQDAEEAIQELRDGKAYLG